MIIFKKLLEEKQYQRLVKIQDTFLVISIGISLFQKKSS